MQSSSFRLVSAVVTLLLLVGVVGVVVLVIHTTPASSLATTRQLRPTSASLSRKTSATAATPLAQPSLHRITVPTATGAIVAAILRATPTPTPGAKATTQATLRNAPTPTVSAMSAVSMPMRLTQTNWRTYSNANHINDLTVVNTMIWAATEGGVGVWDRNNNTFAKFTTIDGLTVNRTTTVVDCPLPGFGLVFGSNQGLQIFEQARGSWKTLNSTNSEMHFDDVSTLYCSPEHAFLVVGYADHGLELFDVQNGWTLLDQRRGLPQNSVTAVTVIGDREAIWIASGPTITVLTEDGVIVYDKSNTPLESAPITVITSDAQGVVWLGAGNKVYRIDGKEWTIYSDTYVLASPFPTGAIRALAVVGEGKLWIGSAAGELCLFDPVAVTCQTFFTAQELKSTSGISALAVDALERLYVATTSEGVRMFDSKAWRTYRVADELILGNRVRALAQDSAGLLWLATEAGLYQIDPVTERIVQSFTSENTPYPVTEITTLYPASKGGLWVGGEGVGYFDGIRWTTYTTADGLASDRIQAIAGDAQKRIWFGTAAGLSVWNGDTFFTLTRANRLPSDNILALLADDETMWIGSDAGLLRFVDNQFQVYTMATTALADNRVTALAKVADGALLVGTARGLSRRVANEMSIIAETRGYAISAIGVMEDDDTLWLGTQGKGLLYFDGKSWTSLPEATNRAEVINPPDQHINAIAVDRQGSVWLAGAEGGMLRYIP